MEINQRKKPVMARQMKVRDPPTCKFLPRFENLQTFWFDLTSLLHVLKFSCIKCNSAHSKAEKMKN